MSESQDGSLPLTRAQLDVWLAQQAQPGTEWQLGIIVHIEGPVDQALLQEAIRWGVREAEATRTSFFDVDGQVVQRVVPGREPCLRFHDVRSAPDPMSAARALTSSIQQTPMPFDRPLINFALIQTGDAEYVWFSRCLHGTGGGA
jgi:glycopeptidolipid biosynthesis protein